MKELFHLANKMVFRHHDDTTESFFLAVALAMEEIVFHKAKLKVDKVYRSDICINLVMLDSNVGYFVAVNEYTEDLLDVVFGWVKDEIAGKSKSDLQGKGLCSRQNYIQNNQTEKE